MRRGVGPFAVAFAATLASIVAAACGPDEPPRVRAGPPAEDALFGCHGRAPFFTAEDLRGPATAAEGDGELARALRRTLTREDGFPVPIDPVPLDGWVLVAETETQALVVHVASEGLPAITYDRAEAGWRPATSSGCSPRRAAPGLAPAEWWLESPAPRDQRTFRVMVSELGCHGGKPTEPERIVPPDIEYRDNEVEVAFLVRPAEGDVFTCPSHPGTPYELELTEVLGDRRLLDGGVLPPREPTKP